MLKMQVIGSLGQDANVKDVNGKKVINFSVAHSENYVDSNGQKQSKTTWVECAKWGEKVGVAEYLKKGTKVFVEGTPSIKSYQKQDGTTASSLALQVIAIELLGGGQQPTTTATPTNNAPPPIVEAENDLPF